MSKTSIKDRDEIVKMRESGMTFQAIANMYGVSRQCIEQIVNRDKHNARHRTDAYRKYTREYYKQHKEACLEYQRRWKAKHPNYFSAYYYTHKKDKAAKETIDKT